MRINQLAIEITRRCNIQCSHCLRGHSQNIDIPLEYIDVLLDQVDSIGHFCPTGGEPSLNIPAIEYFIEGCKKRNISIDTFYIATNGISLSDRFVNVCETLYTTIKYPLAYNVGLQISNDVYHLEKAQYNDSLLTHLPYYSKRENDYCTLSDKLHYEGLSVLNYPEIATTMSTRSNVYYLNVYGNIINGCDWSYENQNHHILTHVETLKLIA